MRVLALDPRLTVGGQTVAYVSRSVAVADEELPDRTLKLHFRTKDNDHEEPGGDLTWPVHGDPDAHSTCSMLLTTETVIGRIEISLHKIRGNSTTRQRQRRHNHGRQAHDPTTKVLLEFPRRESTHQAAFESHTWLPRKRAATKNPKRIRLPVPLCYRF